MDGPAWMDQHEWPMTDEQAKDGSARMAHQGWLSKDGSARMAQNGWTIMNGPA